MLPINPADLVPLILGGTTYFIKVPSHIEHGHWRSDIEAEGVVHVSPKAMAARAAQLVRDFAPPDQQEPLLAVIDAELQRVSQPDAALAASPDYEALHRTLCDIDPVFAGDAVMGRRWMNVAPFLAAYRFLRGWEGGDLPPVRLMPNGHVSRAQIDALPLEDVAAIGWKAIDLMSLKASAEKNSQPLSSSPKSRKTSKAETPAPTTAAG
jgi:hypothetical protein